MVSTLGEFAAGPAGITPTVAFWAGVVGSVGFCAVVRLPILLAYLLGMGRSRKHALILSGLFVLGLVMGTAILGTAGTGDATHRVVQVDKHLFWGLGLGLLVVGLLISGLINPQLLPPRLQGSGRLLAKAVLPGAFLSGGALGLLQTPACPSCGQTLQCLLEAGAAGGASSGLALVASFAAGQSLVILAVGIAVSLLRPELLGWLRARMCSVENRTQLLAGNLLMLLGIYFVIVG